MPSFDIMSALYDEAYSIGVNAYAAAISGDLDGAEETQDEVYGSEDSDAGNDDAGAFEMVEHLHIEGYASPSVEHRENRDDYVVEGFDEEPEEADYLHDEILERDYAELEDQYDTLAGMFEELQGVTNELQDRHEELLNLTNRLVEKRSVLVREVGDLQVDVYMLEYEWDDVEDEVIALREDCEDLQFRHERDQAVIRNLVDERAQLRRDVEYLHAQVYRLDDHRGQMDGYADGLENTAVQLLIERNYFQNRLNNLWTAHNWLVRDRLAALHRLEGLQAAFCEERAYAQELERRLEWWYNRAVDQEEVIEGLHGGWGFVDY